MKISEEKWLIVLNLEGLKALCEDYTEKFPDWKEDKCKKTIRNPIWLNISTYWSSTEYSSITARVLFMNNRGAANNYLKENNHYVVCVPI
jgi:hypothetical protein